MQEEKEEDQVASAEEVKYPVVLFDRAEAACREMKEDNRGLSTETPKGYKEVRKAKTKAVSVRTAVERKRKELNSPALVYTRNVNAEAERVKVMLKEIEEPLQLMLDEADAKKEAEIQAKKDALIAEQKAKEDAERAEREKVEKVERAKREAEHQAKMEAERVKLEAEKEQMKAEAAKQAAELKKQQEAQATLKKIADEENARRLAELAADRDRLAREQAAASAAAAEATAKAAEAQKILDAQAEKNRIIAEKKAATAALTASKKRRKEFSKDVEPLRKYARAVEIIEAPQDLSKQATDLVDECHEKIRDAVEDIWKAIHTHEEIERIEQSV